MEIQSLRSTTENYPAVYKRYVLFTINHLSE